MKKNILLVAWVILWFITFGKAYSYAGFITKDVSNQAIEALVKKHDEKYRKAIEKGVLQVAAIWQSTDGSKDDFIQFCLTQYVPDSDSYLLETYEKNFNAINGYTGEAARIVSEKIQLDKGEIKPVDMLFAEISIPALLANEYFKTKIAFNALLNFPTSSLEEKNRDGLNWSREDWAKTRLAEKFIDRYPTEILQKKNKSYIQADAYISQYNIYMNNLLTEDGKRLFPKDMKLISHWGLRDEIKAEYKTPNSLEKQRMIAKVMERIISQEIPKNVINSDKYDWAPYSNKVFDKNGKEIKAESENAERYKYLKNVFLGEKLLDDYDPSGSTAIDRHFSSELEIPEKEVEQLLLSIVASPMIKDVSKIIEKRLGRKLEPFDIWYNGFENKAPVDETELNKLVSEKYPNIKAFQDGIPDILTQLGFSEEKAKWLGAKITVDPGRGAGHALGAEGREFNAHLRTRFTNGKMDYKSYNVAIHELGHCVEQVHSMTLVDNTLMAGIPNIAFTEAFAFLFQSRDLRLLGFENAAANDDEKALSKMWETYEISGVSLVMMEVWRWMYENPQTSETELKNATIQIAKDIWNKYYAPVFGVKDCTLLAVYSHMIDCGMYLPNYPIGHIISYQIENYIKGKNIAQEMSRICVLGNLTPEIWMKQAIGETISSKPLLQDVERAVKNYK